MLTIYSTDFHISFVNYVSTDLRYILKNTNVHLHIIYVHIFTYCETLTAVILSTSNFTFVKCKYILKNSTICYDLPIFSNIPGIELCINCILSINISKDNAMYCSYVGRFLYRNSKFQKYTYTCCAYTKS